MKSALRWVPGCIWLPRVSSVGRGFVCPLCFFCLFLPCLFVYFFVFAGGPGPIGFPGSHLLREELFVRGAGLVPSSGPQVTKRSPEELQMHVYVCQATRSIAQCATVCAYKLSYNRPPHVTHVPPTSSVSSRFIIFCNHQLVWLLFLPITFDIPMDERCTWIF